MRALNCWLLGLLLTVVVGAEGARLTTPDHRDTAADEPVPLARVLEAAHRLANFFLNHTRALNFDAILGTRIAEGQLRMVLGRVVEGPSSPEVSAADALSMYRVLELAKTVSERTLPLLKAHRLQDYQRLSELLQEGFWALEWRPHLTDPELVFPVVLADETLSEQVSDSCIGEMLGHGERVEGPCSPSPACWDLMTLSRISGYSLTHGLIYLMVGQRMGCEQAMEQQGRRGGQPHYTRLMDVACANALQEMKETAAKGFPEADKDLFMEQTAICGMLGFEDFLSPDWLKEMLTWQRAGGCYGLPPSAPGPPGPPSQPHTRAKREEKLLPDGCLAHKSAVALAALSVYAHHMALQP